MDWSTNDIPVFVYADVTWNNENLGRVNHGISELLEGTYHTGESSECRLGGRKSCFHFGRDIYGAMIKNAIAWGTK